MLNFLKNWWYNVKGKHNLERSPVDSRDFKVRASKSIPPWYSMKEYVVAVRNQSNIGSCGPHAGCAAVELLKNVKGEWILDESAQELSELDLYYHTRENMGTLPKDSGVYLRNMCKVLQQRGVAPEKLWPYYPNKFNTHPSMLAESFALYNKILEYARVSNIAQLKSELAKGNPVIFGVYIYSNFSKLVDNTVPEPNETKLGGHAMLCVGYDDETKTIEVLNSWGPQWGDFGFCKIKYDYFEKQLIESWSIKY